jgi:predicted permease
VRLMADEMQTTRFRFWLWLIRAIGVIVPRRLRADWRQEWEAELRNRETLFADWDRLNWRTKLDLLRRSIGAFRDALLLQPRRMEEEMFQDLRFGARMLRTQPGFTLIAVLALALGIGANTAIFSVVNALLFKPLPYRDPQRLVQFYQTRGFGDESGGTPAWSYPKYEAMRAYSESFESVAAVASSNVNVTGTDEPERLASEHVSASYFRTLGVEAVVGRTFLPEEDSTPNSHAVALISYGLWQRRFGSDPDIIGKRITLNRIVFTVVGVAPAGFRGQSGVAEVWIPMMMAPMMMHARRLIQPYAYWMDMIARLKPGVSLVKAQAEMEVTAGKIAAALPPLPPPPPGMRIQKESGTGIRLVELKEAKTNPVIKKSFLILLAAVGLVLLIACVNTANLLLARAAARQKEMAVRLALGASRLRLMRQFLTESLLLALCGGVTGLLVAIWGIHLLTGFKVEAASDFWASYGQMLRFYDVRLDGQMLLFNLLLSLATGLLFGLAPALRASRPDLSEALKEGAGTESFGRWRRLNVRGALVVAEIALSFALLVGAGLMIRTLAQLSAVELGFEPQGVMTFNIPSRDGNQQLRERVASLPGVETAAVASSAPLLGYSSMSPMRIEGREQPAGGGDPFVGIHSVSPEYFQALRIPLIKGRALTGEDRAGSKRVALINETAARKIWPGEDPIGKRIRPAIGWQPADDWAEVVGVVGDVKYGAVEEADHPDVYLSCFQPTDMTDTLIVRSTLDRAALTAAVRRESLALDRNIPVYNVRTMDERISEVTSRTRFIAFLLAIFAGLALILSAIGIYGVISYAVAARTREIGIRMALGARASDVLRLIIRQGMTLTLIGVGIGAAASLALTRYLATMLFGVNPTDPLTFAAIAVLLTLVALLACWIPARRATRVDPMVALRDE